MRISLICFRNKMPQKCCVPGCKSNYSSQEYISVFTFPSDPDLKEKWIQQIGRKDYVVNKNSVVCAKHFQPHFVITVDCVKRDDGTLLSVPRAKPKLQNDAFPTIFPNVSCLSSESPYKIKIVTDKLDKLDSHEPDSVHQSCLIKDSITSFHSLCREINSHILYRSSTSDLSTASENVDRTQYLQPSEEADHGEAAYIALKLEFLEQQRKYMHTFTDHYIDRMIREGTLWARNTVVHRPGFTEMCENLDKAVEFLCLMCEELTSTVTADTNDIKAPHPEQYLTSLELPDSVSDYKSVPTVSVDKSISTVSGDKSLSAVSGAYNTKQILVPGQTTGMYCCPHCSVVFSHHSMLYDHLTREHSSSSNEMSQTSAEVCVEYSDESVDKACRNHSEETHKLECMSGESPKLVKENCDIQTRGKTSSRNAKRCSWALPKTTFAVEVNSKLNMTDDRNNGGNLRQTRSRSVMKSYKSDVCGTGYMNVGRGQLQMRKHKQNSGCVKNISELTEAYSQKLIHETNDILTDNLHSEKRYSNEALQAITCPNEKNSEVYETNKCHRAPPRLKTMRRYTTEKPYKCDICDMGFKSTSRLLAHKKRHQGGQSFQCAICNAGFDRSYQLKAHISKHTGVKPFHCDVCGAGFTVKSTMQIHMRNHTGEKPYICDDCGARFVNRRKLKIHRVSHTGEKPYKCDVCGSGFNQAFSLQLHKRKHTGEKPYKCDICGLKFAGNCSLKMHRRRHTGEKPYRCDVCGVGFTHNVGLQIHKSRHKGDKPFVCEICDLKFSVNCSLQHHKRKHTGDKPYKCDVCDVAFSVKSSLINHRRKHTGETPYICDDCGLRFSVITSLQNHQRKHTGIKPYLCDMCGTEFAHSGSLRDHKRLHTGEKPYKCGLCGADFSNRKKLQRHRKTHTTETFYAAGVTGLDLSESVNLLV